VKERIAVIGGWGRNSLSKSYYDWRGLPRPSRAETLEALGTSEKELAENAARAKRAEDKRERRRLRNMRREK
jgi:hypothetical protein